MLLTDVAKVAEAAKNKAELCNNHFGKYFMRAVRGVFILTCHSSCGILKW